MSLVPFQGARVRALSVISICALAMAVVSAWATRQHAGAATRPGGRHYSASRFALPDTGRLTPEASTITVNSLSDVANATDGLCTLREAITAANSNTASGAIAGECAAGSSSGSDAIDMTGLAGTINLTSALPQITGDTTITGPPSALITVTRSPGGGNYRILAVTSGIVSISNLSLTNGNSPSAGGGILNGGTLTLTNCEVRSNQSSSGFGGAIDNQGTMT